MMSRGWWVGAGLVVVAMLASVGVAVGTRRGVGGESRGGAAAIVEEWNADLAAVDRAVDANDLARASHHWRAAYGSALRSQRWEPMLAAGDAAVRIGRAMGPTDRFDAAARQCYLGALFRAREDQSIEGVLRVAEALAQLGDTEVARGAVRIADGLGRSPRPAPRFRIEESPKP
jgi:hypothetical protein